jgi:transposase
MKANNQEKREEWEQEKAQYLQEIQELREQVAFLTGELQKALERNKELEEKKKEPPSFVKANAPVQEKGMRKKRGEEHNQARRCETPTEIVEHPLEICPDCQGRVSSVHLGRTRQVLEIPEPQPMIIREHRIAKGWCSYCRQWKEAQVDLSGEVRGKSRVGIRLSALIAQMRSVLRLPFRQIQAWLAQGYQVRLSVGEVAEITERVARAGEEEYQAIRQRVQKSEAVHADETGWREQGQNGYIWLIKNPKGDTYFTYEHSRSGDVIDKMLGPEFEGVLITDFYAGYNDTPGGKHQRCWVHFLRDLHKCKQDHPLQENVKVWAGAIHELYERAKEESRHPDDSYRQQAAQSLQSELVRLVLPVIDQPDHPGRTLAKRLLRFQGELFLFVRHSEVLPDNNAAERAIRPLVIARKISGGSCSSSGSRTRMILASLTATWQSQMLPVCEQFIRLLQCPLPQV